MVGGSQSAVPLHIYKEGPDSCNTSGVTMARAQLGTKDYDHMW
jgi:hypothetical protein